MKKIFALTLAVLACAGMLAGCGGQAGETTPTTEPTTPSTTTEGPVLEEDVIGKIESVSDSFVRLVIYTATGTIDDYTKVDISALAPTQETDYIFTVSTTKYFKVVDGQASEATREDLKAGEFIGITKDDNSVQQIYIYSQEQAAPGGTIAG